MHNASVGIVEAFHGFGCILSTHCISSCQGYLFSSKHGPLQCIWNLVIAFDVCQRHALPHIAKPISTQEPKPTQSSREYASINVLALDRCKIGSDSISLHPHILQHSFYWNGALDFLVFDDSSVEMREACAKISMVITL